MTTKPKKKYLPIKGGITCSDSPIIEPNLPAEWESRFTKIWMEGNGMDKEFRQILNFIRTLISEAEKRGRDKAKDWAKEMIDISLLERIRSYLGLSEYSVQTNYISPVERLRMEANELEQKIKDIEKLDNLLQELK